MIIVIGAIIMLSILFLLVYGWKDPDTLASKITSSRDTWTADPRVSNLMSKIDEKYRIVYEYYIQTYIGERIKDSKWMKANCSGPNASKEVPAFRRYQILNSPQTKEGMVFRDKMKWIFERKYDQIKDMGVDNHKKLYTLDHVIKDLSNINDEIDITFPEAFVSIKREEKLKELGI